MAALEDLCEEATCSICLNYFKDPVTIACGHNFCRPCLTQSWEKSGSKETSCPLCREEILQRNLSSNWQLANIVAAVKKLNPNVEGEKGEEQEAQENFCEDDETHISLADDKEHQDHRQIPLETTAPDYKNQGDAEMEKIIGEITRDCWFLEDQKKHIWTQIEELKYRIGRKTNDQEHSSLENLILKMQDELQCEKKEAFEKSVVFLLELKSKIQDFHDQKRSQGNVTLDPEPVRSFHVLSDGRKHVKYGAEPQDLPDNPGQFCHSTCVSGCKGFPSGCDAEEFAMRREGIWPVEVATKSARGKGHVPIGPKEPIWAMGQWAGSCPDTRLPLGSVLSLSEKTKEVQGYLISAAGQVGFCDGEMEAQINAISEVPFSGVSVLPFFYM